MTIWRALITTLIILSFFSAVGMTPAHGDELYSYQIKGVIRGLPGNGRAKNEVLIKHEAIPDYRDDSGNVVGMSGMTMPFYLAQGVSAEGLKVGDTVEFTLQTMTKPAFTERVINIKKVE